MNRDLHLVLFDFDGTLCDSASTIVRLMKLACVNTGLPEPEDNFIRKNIGLGVGHAALAYSDGDGPKAAELAKCYRRLANDEYLGRAPPLDPLFAGALEAVGTLRAQHYLTAIITNKSRTGLNSLITRHRLDELIDISITADDSRVKPAPDMAREAMRQLGVSTQNTLLVGDTEIDADCAMNAGIDFIGVAWGYHSQDRLLNKGARAIIDRFDDLPEAVGKLFSEAGIGRS